MKWHRKPTVILVLLCSFSLRQFDAFVTLQATPAYDSLTLNPVRKTFLAARQPYAGHREQRNQNASGPQRYRRNDKRRSFISPEDNSTPEERAWLVQTTQILLGTQAGTLVKGKWHEVVSMLRAWSRRSKFDKEAPLIVERLLKRLLDERAAGNTEAKVTTELYNILLDSWACAAIFGTHSPAVASQRGREILVSLQETFEREADPDLRPDADSFYLVFQAVCRTEGPLISRRLLAWMEYLHKVGKNESAKPSRRQYISLLDAYANSKGENAGLLTEGFIRHMNATGIVPDTYCYNIAIKAWARAKRGRESAEHADRILEEMEAPKDLVTYSSVIAAWAASGMRSHAVARAEELLQDIENTPGLEANTIVMNSVMSTWVKSRNPAAVNRTAEMLDRMEQSSNCRPDLFSYNTHLHALSMHAQRTGYARRASDLLEELQRRSAAGESHLRPNLFSYNVVIDAWSKANEYDAAWSALKILRNMIDGQGPQPDNFSFNQVLSALSRSSRPGAAQHAERLFQYLIQAHRLQPQKNARPDVVGCTSVIVALSRSGEADGAERAESLLSQLKTAHASGEHHLKPTRAVYNALIDCWAKSGRGTYAARRAEALLHEMEDSGDLAVSPDIVTYNAVLNAWAKSGTRCCANKAEEYLERMWELYDEGRGCIAPNDKSFNTVSGFRRSNNLYLLRATMCQHPLIWTLYFRSLMLFRRVPMNSKVRRRCVSCAEWINYTKLGIRMRDRMRSHIPAY